MPPPPVAVPRVSVLMPAHNAQRTIAESVASALAQTVEDLEVIVVDDGSAEPVSASLRSFRDERLRILRTDRNRGAAAARNVALAAARAPVVAQLDADDLWYEDHLDTLLPEMGDPGVGLVYSNAEVRGHPTGLSVWIARESAGGRTAVQRAGVVHPVPDLASLYQGNPIPAPAVAIRTDAARAVGGYPEWLTVGEDYLLYIRVWRAGWRFAFVDRATAVYRWPEPGRGATYDRRRHSRQEAKLFAVLALESPGSWILWNGLAAQLAEILRTHVPATIPAVRAARRIRGRLRSRRHRRGRDAAASNTSSGKAGH